MISLLASSVLPKVFIASVKDGYDSDVLALEIL